MASPAERATGSEGDLYLPDWVLSLGFGLGFRGGFLLEGSRGFGRTTAKGEKKLVEMEAIFRLRRKEAANKLTGFLVLMREQSGI